MLVLLCVSGCGGGEEAVERVNPGKNDDQKNSPSNEQTIRDAASAEVDKEPEPSPLETPVVESSDSKSDASQADESQSMERILYSEVTPVTVTAANNSFNAMGFPAPDETLPSLNSSETIAMFDLAVKFDDAVSHSVVAFETLGFEQIERSDLEKKHSVFYLRSDELFVRCTLREEAKELVQLNVAVLGNVDIRTIPKLEVENVISDMLDSCVYQSNASLEDVITHYEQVLTSSGWQSYRSFVGTHIENDSRGTAAFRQNGVGINVSAFEHGGEVLVSLYCAMLEEDVPTPRGVTEYEFDDVQFQQRFVSDHSVPELVEFFTREMIEFGWTMPFGKQFDDLVAGILFTRPNHDPVFLELRKQEEGGSTAYMSAPTRQVLRAAQGEFEVEYENGLPIEESHFHTVDYQAIPFHEPMNEGAGRTIAESVFFVTERSIDETCEFYRSHFTKLGWIANERLDEESNEILQNSILTFTKGDAEIIVSVRKWIDDSNRVNIEGNGIRFPGTAFCHMMARPTEVIDIE